MKISKEDRTILKKAEIILYYYCAQKIACSNCLLKSSCNEFGNLSYLLHDITKTLEVI